MRLTAAVAQGLDVNSPLFIAMATVFATGIVALGVWSVQRIINRLDTLIETTGDLKTRMTLVEAKQRTQTEVVRRTATKVGVRRLPPEPEAEAVAS